MDEPLFPCTNALQTPNPPFWTTKTAVPKFPQNGGSTPTPCLDKAVHAQGGRGREFSQHLWTCPNIVRIVQTSSETCKHLPNFTNPFKIWNYPSHVAKPLTLKDFSSHNNAMCGWLFFFAANFLRCPYSPSQEIGNAHTTLQSLQVFQAVFPSRRSPEPCLRYRGRFVAGTTP